MVEVGERAPDFHLPSTLDKPVTLTQELKTGPVVLVFYVLDWSPVCSEEMCDFTAGLGDFERLGANVFGISVDSTFSHKAWAKSLNISIPLLSDFNKEVAGAYSVLYNLAAFNLNGIAKRSVFVVGRDQKVKYKWVTDNPKVKPDIEEIKKVLGSLKQGR